MKQIKGDLIKLAQAGEFDVIIHGCNCFHTMGAGIAHTIRRAFPEAYYADGTTPYADHNKLGLYSFAHIGNLIVVNAYTQFDYRGPRNADYAAIKKAFNGIKKQFTGKRIGYPLIGAGLAGGNWNIISQIIDEELHGEDHTLVIFEP